jgi:hypothetical protein
MMPALAYSEQRRKYSELDMADWPRYWNAVNAQEHTMEKPIEFRFTDKFPIRSPSLLRCAIADPSCISVLCMLNSLASTIFTVGGSIRTALLI